MNTIEQTCKRKYEQYRKLYGSVFLYVELNGNDENYILLAYKIFADLLKNSIYDNELLKYLEAIIAPITEEFEGYEKYFDICEDGPEHIEDNLYRVAYHGYKDTEAYELREKAKALFYKSKYHHIESASVDEFYSIAEILHNICAYAAINLREVLKHSPVLNRRLMQLSDAIAVATTKVKEIEEEESGRTDTISSNTSTSAKTEDHKAHTEVVPRPSRLPARYNQTTQKSKTKTTKSKASPLRNASSGKLDDLHPAVKIFKRFVALNGKEYNRAKIERILKSLQREIINHTITKDYEYAAEVNYLQKKLVDALNSEHTAGKQVGKMEIKPGLLAKLQYIIGVAKPADAIALLKSYVRLTGSTDKDKAKRLLKRFDRYNIETPSSALTPHLKSAKNALLDFVEGKSTAIALDEFALHGLDYINYR